LRSWIDSGDGLKRPDDYRPIRCSVVTAMSVQQLFQSGQLDEAVKALTAEVRDNPTDPKRRTFLFELLCFAGDYSRAEKHLDVLSQGGQQSEIGGLFYRGVLAAEKTRHEMFEKQEYPKPESASNVHITGTINGKSFHDLADSDPRVGANLEMFVAGSYMWVPFTLLSSIQIQPPKRLRDLLWIPAVVRTSAAFQGRELGEVLLPALHPFSWRSADPAVRLGRATAWEGGENEEPFPRGQKVLLADDEEWPLLELRDVQFVMAQAAP
jgi:type VI secretion system protein ImpE